MDLKSFIKTALIDLVTAIDEAKHELKDPAGSLICPPSQGLDANLNPKIDSSHQYQKVEFDLAVSVEEKNTSQGGVGIKVLGLAANAGENAISNYSTVSRVKFHVPIGLKPKV